MPADPTAPVVRYIHTLAAGVADTRPDQGLLGRFVAHRDPIAFAALVDRHGPMILRLCRRALRNEHDAEDAFQATFLVVARRVGGIRKLERRRAWEVSQPNFVTSLAASTNGGVLAVGDLIGTIRLRSIGDGVPLAPLVKAHDRPVWLLEFYPDGH